MRHWKLWCKKHYQLGKTKDEKVLSALLDLQIAIGKLQASMIDVDKAIQKLMAAESDVIMEKDEHLEVKKHG